MNSRDNQLANAAAILVSKTAGIFSEESETARALVIAELRRYSTAEECSVVGAQFPDIVGDLADDILTGFNLEPALEPHTRFRIVDEIFTRIQPIQDRLTQAIDALTKAKAAIESLSEWAPKGWRSVPAECCRYCLNREHQGHSPNCPRKNGLDAINAALKP